MRELLKFEGRIVPRKEGEVHHCFLEAGCLGAESEVGNLGKVREAPGEESSARM